MDGTRTGKISDVPRPGWVVTRAARVLWQTLRPDCRAIPRSAWRRWGATLALGFVACCAQCFLVARFTRDRAEHGLQAWDERQIVWFAENGPISFQNAILLESAGNLMYLIPLTITASIIAIRMHRPLIAITIQVAYWLQRPIVLVGWETWNRTRPKLIENGVAAPPLHSFPSGHAALCIAVYGFLAYLWVRSSRSVVEKVFAVIIVALLTATVSLARVRLGSHWPSDILAGAVLGVLWVSVVIFAYRGTVKRIESPA
jgi:undecaprenyl-diphosphatase